MVSAIGVDMIEVERIAAALRRHGRRFLERVYSAQEQSYCGDRASALAARFAAKEAAAKSLGTGIGSIDWRDIEVVRAPSGAPSLRLHGRAAALARSLCLGEPLLSLSHTREHAIAMVVWRGHP